MIAVLFVSSSVFAAGDAGCGLGSQIWRSNGKLAQIFAVTTNASFYSQTFGITSGTSGCTASGLVQNDKAIQYFVEVNQEDLTREIAVGQGEKINTLAQMYGCSSSETQAFATKAQSSFSTVVPSSSISASEMIRNIRTASIPDACHGS